MELRQIRRPWIRHVGGGGADRSTRPASAAHSPRASERAAAVVALSARQASWRRASAVCQGHCQRGTSGSAHAL